MKKNQVFLSFKGEQIRRTFLCHLCSSLKKKGIATFTASESPRDSSLQAIQESLVAIPVISKNHTSLTDASLTYAFLNLWVEELADIIECERRGTLTAVPIFFQLDSTDILNMLRNEEKNTHNMLKIQRRTLKIVEKWLEAHVTNESGFKSLDCTDDSELVAKVTTFVSNILASSSSRNQKSTVLIPDKSLKLAEDMSRLGPIVKKGTPQFWEYKDDDTDISRSWCTEELRSVMLNAKSTVIGVCGIEGVGKTSVVRQLYDEVSPQFQHHVFIKSKIRSQDNSYRLFTDLATLKESSFHGKSVEFIKEMIRHRRVLLVADDIDNIKQLKGIIKDANWFGRGSRVIVITQDMSLLTQCGVEDIYKVECATHQEAILLFSIFAFKQRYPLPDFEALSYRAVQVSNGLPLALKILGSFLYNKTKDEWESKIGMFEALQDNYITKVCKHIGVDENVPRNTIKGDENVPRHRIKADTSIEVDEANLFPFYAQNKY